VFQFKFCAVFRTFHIAVRWATYKKPTAQTGTFGFADTQSQRKKTKRACFLPTLDKDSSTKKWID